MTRNNEEMWTNLYTISKFLSNLPIDYISIKGNAITSGGNSYPENIIINKTKKICQISFKAKRKFAFIWWKIEVNSMNQQM